MIPHFSGYILLFTITYLVVVGLLNLTGLLTYGYGLGDGFIDLIIAGAVAVLFILKYMLQRTSGIGFKIFVIAVALFAIVKVTAAFTVNRGPEWRWNGKVFFSRP